MKKIYLRLFFILFGMQLASTLFGQAFTVFPEVTPSNCHDCTGKIGLLVPGGTPPYSYAWSVAGSPSIPSLDGLCPGSYSVTVTDATGATSVATAVVPQLSNLNATYIVNQPSCNGSCDGKIDVTVSGGQTPYTYLWSNSSTPQDLVNICAGSYNLTITDGTGCTKVLEVLLNQPLPIVINSCVTDVTCYGGNNGMVDITVTGGTAPYTYLWGSGNTTQDISNMSAGTITVTVVDAHGCTVSTPNVITQPTAMVLNTNVTNSSSGIPNGFIDLTVTGGTAPYTYAWSNGANFPDLINLNTGTYTVTVTDSQGCTKTKAVTVTAAGGGGTQLLLTGQVTNSGCGSACTGGILLSVSGSNPNGVYLVQWTGPNGFASTQYYLSNLCVGTYCVTVSDPNNNNTATACYTVGQGQNQLIDIQSSNAAFCNYNDGTHPPVCEMVCPHTTVTYFFDPPLVCNQPLPTQGSVWTVSGAESYSIFPNNREVVVTWGNAGPGLVTLASNNPDLCYSSSHCVTIVEEPVAKFSTDPPAPPTGPLQLCKGQAVTFKNESQYAEQFEWIFSDDLSSSTDENPQHTFLTPGNFTVTLIARSNCLCADTTILAVEVLNTEPPLLDCVGSVCPGETVKYSTSSACSSYSWVVSANGTVVDGGTANDNSITITWGQGPTGSIALSASGCGGAACPQASVFFIPIISDNAEIRGNAFVCPENEEEYTIQLFDGTEYTWALPTGGAIIRGQGTNTIAVAWGATANASTTHWLSVDYYNCYLGCGGTDSIPVKILAPFYIQGGVELCENAPTTFTSKLVGQAPTVNCDWVIYQENGSVFWTSPSPSATLNFPTNAAPGKYRISALPSVAGQTCSAAAELVVKVVAKPPKPAAIGGPSVVCPGAFINYDLLGSEPYSVQWTAFNGTPTSQTGDPANVSWSNNGPRWLAAAYVTTDGLGCKSDTTRLNVTTLTGLTITGNPTVCESTVGFYQTELYPGFDYLWEILPASAGAIKTGQGKNAVEIFWQFAGTHQVRVTACGQSVTFNVTVWPTPAPTVTQPAGLCPGETGAVLTATPYSAYTWKTADGALLSNLASPSVPAGAYTVSVTDVHGCKGSEDFKINLYPKPNVSVTTADPTLVCGDYVSITALTPNDGVFTYQWLLDGLPFGGNTSVLVTNQYGDYSVIVTNEYGCTATNGKVTVYENCNGQGTGIPCTICNGHPKCAPGTIQAVADPTPRCDSFVVVLNDYSGMYVLGSAVWRTGVSGGALLGTATGETASFVYPNAGKYIVDVQVMLSNGLFCEAIDSLNVEAVAQFSQKQACPGDSTRFVDESTRLPGASIASWQWDFGEIVTTDTSSLSSPGYPYASTGTYTATLTVTSSTGCTSSVSEPVLVPDVPSPTFTPPVANCAGNASGFALANPAGIIRTEWDFGHPASGALNQAGGTAVFHNFTPAGTYPVQITTTNTYGCKGSLTQPVNIVPNPFSGSITPGNAVICEGKSITLVAPPGANASYQWSDGSNLQTLVASQEGVYDVTLTNGNGCTYSPPAKSVDVNPAPAGTIKALEINEIGQVIGVAYPSVAVCAGEDVNLQVQDNGAYTYQWSDGNATTEILTFSEDRGNLLTVGSYVYTVTVTNPTTGCTAVFPPFDVTVNPVPSGFNLVANNVCAGTPSTINYSGPQPPEWQIFWNSGEVGPTMVTEDAGLYFVRVVNEFGCSAQSNTVVIFPGPNVDALPAGCHERCNPDTLCLPTLPDIVSWQWYYDGNAIPGATSHQFAATQSGTYYASLVDIHGCQAQSADLTLDLYDGFGNILGQVWSDVNNNGVVDAADTLVAFIPVQLLQNGAVVNANMSGTDGGFNWQNVLATGYVVQIDSQLLSPQWEVVILSDSVGLTGCGGKAFADLLVDAYQCPPIYSSLTLTACPGTSATYNGTAVMAGTSQDFPWQSLLGCDSIVTVTVNPLATSSGAFNPSICPGTTYNYQGVDLSVGQTQNFTLANYLGCDSTVTVTVGALPTSTAALNPKICAGDVYTYQGVNLSVGQTQNFTLTNYQGCDSVVTVSVGALQASAATLNVKVCQGDQYTYQGVNLNVGQTQNFTLTNYQGCDSVVTVSVSALPTTATFLNITICQGDQYTYQGVNLNVGQTQNFILTNYQGCDSIVTVAVGALPTSTSTLNAKVCPGDQYTYQGVNLGVGQTQNFTLSNHLGCDSIVTVVVAALPTSASTLQVQTCPGTPYVYQGTSLNVGQTQNFTLNNYLGCDSVVTVTVAALPTSASTLQVQTCPGTPYVYQGTSLNVGQTQNFTLNNYLGCDSVVTVTVAALPTSAGAASFGVCPNETYTYQGQALAAGTVKDFTLDNWLGCDSIVTVSIYEFATTAETREVTVCPGTSYEYQGFTVEIGQVKDIHFTNGEGCDSLITIAVLAYPDLDFALETENSCPNAGTGALHVQVTPGGSQPVDYALNGGVAQTDGRFDQLAAGDYTVTVRDDNGCVYEQVATIAPTPNLTVELPGALVIPCDSVVVTLAPQLGGDTAGLHLQWWNGAQTPATSTGEAGPVWVEATNHCGDTQRREAEVQWADSDGQPINIYVPNIFAPDAKNPDNHMFRAFFGSNFTLLDYKIQVYDRWGSLLFESKQPEVGWTGLFRDRIMEPGVYPWQLWVKVAFCGRELQLYKKGDVTVER